MELYDNLHSPIRIGNATIKNRIVMSPMGDGLSSNDGSVTDRMIAYYSVRAKGGEVCSIAKACQEMGVSMMDISAGTGESMYVQSANSAYPQGLNVPYAEAVKKVVAIPVGVVGRIRDFEMAERVIKEGKADMAFFGRPFLIDPYFPLKALNGQAESIRWCLSCGTCHNTNKLGGIKCSLNPALQREQWYQHLNKNGAGRSIVVIGGGPAGCEAARIFAMRGFKVTLFEASQYLGGQVKLAAVPQDKDDMNNLEKYYTSILKALSVDVKLNIKADVDMIRKADPFAVVLASGSKPIIPDIPGISSKNVTTAENLLAGNYEEPVDKEIAVIGIGDTGMETAKWLLKRNNKVCMADMLENPKERLTRTGQWKYDDLKKDGVVFYKGCAITEIKANAVVLRRVSDDKKIEVAADIVVLSLGVRPNIEMQAELQRKFENVLTVGNANKASPIYESVAEAFNASWHFDTACEYI